jgi:alcohol dehydrogenase (cytochrome c)
MQPIRPVAGKVFTILSTLGMLLTLGKGSATIAGENALQALTPITNEMLQAPASRDWLMRRGNYSSWGYSALDQIDTGNVGHLKLAWAWNMSPGYQEEAPLVHDGVLFLGNPHNVVQALDGRNGDLLWEYRRQLPKVEGGYHNDLFDRSRGTIAIYDDKVFLTTADAHVVALGARTGKVEWDTKVADYTQGYTFTGGPIVAKGKVIAGAGMDCPSKTETVVQAGPRAATTRPSISYILVPGGRIRMLQLSAAPAMAKFYSPTQRSPLM